MELPSHKSDIERAGAMERCSLAELEPHLAELLTWMKDYNWPVAKILGPILARCDGRIVPHIRVILGSDDDVWKYWLLSEVVLHLAKSIRDELMEDVVRIINSPTPGERQEEVDLVAADVMALYSSEGKVD